MLCGAPDVPKVDEYRFPSWMRMWKRSIEEQPDLPSGQNVIPLPFGGNGWQQM
jgi:hypothetical protein